MKYQKKLRYQKILTVALLSLSFILCLSLKTLAVSQASYTILRTSTPIIIDGQLNEPVWTAAPDVGAFKFPWWQSGKQEQTISKLLWDNKHLYVSFIVEDAHIWAEKTERDSAVFQDDCVEVFTAPNPDRPLTYFNIEMNVQGAFLDQFHRQSGEERKTEEWNGEGIKIATSIVGTLNNDSDTDKYWILEAAIPFDNFAQVAKNTPPKPKEIWYLNLNRLGGQTNLQYSQWSPSQTPKPQFHAAQDFGRVTFSATESPFWKR
ncbi:carbohydrate-binding family 9-like protein [Okeania sp.]|uniref:carbohydrate-binding family 9-like protein n=1 Tax=Okeania sp. TaxID=3100323 RepID=UPI002B4B16E9|nr:carbohydrate-binding family 9-like protein [Okeania sp.]MEB3341389.1 carbohydrate-binding family 9-like protein [Okeania sp.]